MPTIHIELFEGRTPEQKRDLAKAITEVTVQTLGGSAESVDIIFVDFYFVYVDRLIVLDVAVPQVHPFRTSMNLCI